jgi:hypothetical protein
MIFYVGLHHPGDAKHFQRAFISINTIRTRRKPIETASWIMDSGAFTEISTHGAYRTDPADYAEQINRWAESPNPPIAAVSQDYMCEPFITEKTGLSVPDHQRLTVERYDAIRPRLAGAYLMPVLQGFTPAEYVQHLDDYGSRIAEGAWVGVGSVCKRNTNVGSVVTILAAIKRERPDIRLHGFGLKITALREGAIRDLLATADSMAWSYRARIEGRNGNDWREAQAFTRKIETMPVQNGWAF